MLFLYYVFHIILKDIYYFAFESDKKKTNPCTLNMYVNSPINT